jgi:hypothetical protein
LARNFIRQREDFIYTKKIRFASGFLALSATGINRGRDDQACKVWTPTDSFLGA